MVMKMKILMILVREDSIHVNTVGAESGDVMLDEHSDNKQHDDVSVHATDDEKDHVKSEYHARFDHEFPTNDMQEIRIIRGEVVMVVGIEEA
ncbi:hypothetical protein Tco_0003322 [Tanacetum coccineum]